MIIAHWLPNACRFRYRGFPESASLYTEQGIKNSEGSKINTDNIFLTAGTECRSCMSLGVWVGKRAWLWMSRLMRESWHFCIMPASSVDGGVNGPVRWNWLCQWFQMLNSSFTSTFRQALCLQIMMIGLPSLTTEAQHTHQTRLNWAVWDCFGLSKPGGHSALTEFYQSSNQISIGPISPAKPSLVARQSNQCSTAKSKKQFRNINRPSGMAVSMGERPSQRDVSSDVSWSLFLFLPKTCEIWLKYFLCG